MAKPSSKQGKKSGFPFGLKPGKGKAGAKMPAKASGKGAMAPPFMKKK
jgi:hypothetical protein